MKTMHVQTYVASFVIATLLLLQISPALAGGPPEAAANNFRGRVALAPALTLPELARSPLKQGELPANPFVILLRGTYKPVKRCPDLGLFLVNICDGSYLTVKIYSVSGLLEEDEEDREQVIGNFYVAPGMGKPIAYDLPGGALTMVFTGNNLTSVPDGQGGTFLVGTFDLNITEATGVYQSFLGGHNRMVDILHRLADGTLVEHCYCIISRP